jgi:hypothetical protein
MAKSPTDPKRQDPYSEGDTLGYETRDPLRKGVFPGCFFGFTVETWLDLEEETKELGPKS